ncbi:hypothetical protein F5Y10DRAFT_246737 [Nemania abortiva]|nr:hypothetical protein F5Y10DRAFT_246737 [Nemania abortiva]
MGLGIGIPSLLLSFLTWWEARRARLRLVAERAEIETIDRPPSQLHDNSSVNLSLQNLSNNEPLGSLPPASPSAFTSDYSPEVSVPISRDIDSPAGI